MKSVTVQTSIFHKSHTKIEIKTLPNYFFLKLQTDLIKIRKKVGFYLVPPLYKQLKIEIEAVTEQDEHLTFLQQTECLQTTCSRCPALSNIP